VSDFAHHSDTYCVIIWLSFSAPRCWRSCVLFCFHKEEFDVETQCLPSWQDPTREDRSFALLFFLDSHLWSPAPRLLATCKVMLNYLDWSAGWTVGCRIWIRICSRSLLVLSLPVSGVMERCPSAEQPLRLKFAVPLSVGVLIHFLWCVLLIVKLRISFFFFLFFFFFSSFFFVVDDNVAIWYFPFSYN